MKTNWQTKKLSDIKSIIFMRGNGLKKSLIKKDGKFNCILYGELYTKYKHPIINEVVTKTDFDGKIKSVKGDVLVPGTTTADAYGIAIARSINKNGIILGGDINILRTKNKEIISDYLSYFLNGPAKLELASYANGTNIMHLSNKNIQKIEISYPPLPEQHRIVKILDEIFADVAKAKENAEKNLQNAKELFESYLQSVFANPGNNWEGKKIKEIGKTQTGLTPKTSNKKYYGNFVPFITPADVDIFRDGSVRYNSRGLSDTGLNVGRKIDKNSVLMVCIGATIGKVGFVTQKVSCNQQINTLTPESKFEAKFFYYALSTKSFFKKIIKGSSRATLPIINKGKWENLVVSFPKTRIEQKSIVAKLDALSAKIKKLEAIYQQKLADLEELKKSVLKKAFSGEL